MRLVPVAVAAATGLAWATALGCAAAPGGSSPEPEPAATAPEPASASTAGASCERIEQIVVRRAERVLVATCVGGAERTLPVALSRGTGPKQMSGDQRVPAGEYRIASPARPSRFHRFVPIDYPAPADAARALAEGRLSREDHGAIVTAHREGRMPPQETPLGGHLGFHGEGKRWRGHLELDWTEGCVAMQDADIEWLGERALPGTPVRIEP